MPNQNALLVANLTDVVERALFERFAASCAAVGQVGKRAGWQAGVRA
ncbi:MAG: hypothetical protein V3T17_19885 [Pseudomonadales bacterium]